jgi:hypothetical protein
LALSTNLLLRSGFVAVALIGVSVLTVGCGGGDRHPRVARATPAPSPAATPAPVPRLFAPDSVWNTPLPDDAPVDPSSSQLARELARQVAEVETRAAGPWLGSRGGSTPIYRVPRDQPTVAVTLDSAIPMSPREAFAAVPLPPDARPARGGDAHLTVWQPATDKLWEFFQMEHRPDGWHASWGGAIEHVSRSPGYYTSRSWPGGRWYWGATATSLPVAAGVIQAAELARGEIDHALALNLVRTRADEYAWPAQRTDGASTGPETIPEGAHLRIDPTVDLEALELPAPVLTIARAAQRYGLIVRDKSATVSLYAEDPAALDRDPYPRLFGPDYPDNIFKLIGELPWDRMQVLRMHLCRTRPAEELRAARDTGTGGCPPSGD